MSHNLNLSKQTSMDEILGMLVKDLRIELKKRKISYNGTK